MTAKQRAELYQLTRMLWWRHELGQLSDEALEALLDVLNGARQEIVKKIRAELEGLVSVSEWRKDYDQQVVAWLNEVTAAARGTVTSLITETSIGVALASVETYNSILSFEGAAKSVKLVSGLTRDQVRQFFVDQPLGGRLLSEWVDRSFTSGAQQLMLDAIRTGVMQGESYRKLERRVMDAAAQGFGITQREAATLVRTYVQSANTGAQEAVYKQNEDIITGYKRVETLDNHTCRICALMDGAKYGLHEKKPDLPAHPNCRGVYLPLLKSFRELGLDMDEFEEVPGPGPSGHRQPGVHPARENRGIRHQQRDFHGWLMSLPEDSQLKTSIGPVRLRLLKEGKVSWDELSNKQTGLPYTLKELGFDEQGNSL